MFFVLISWFFVFNIYEVKFNVEKHIENGFKTFEIYPKALNLLGFQVPFRKIGAKYELPEVSDDKIFIEIVENICSIKIDEGNVLDELNILCSTKYNLFPEKINLSLK